MANSNRSEPRRVDVGECARCSTQKDAYHHASGAPLPEWSPVIARPDGKTQEYERVFCPACTAEVPDAWERRRIVSEKLEAQLNS